MHKTNSKQNNESEVNAETGKYETNKNTGARFL